MGTKNFTTIVTWICLLLVECFGQNLTNENRNTDQHRRIFHGNMADIGDLRFMVKIMFEREPEDWVCGGSIVSDHFILTAAHCMANQICSEMKIFSSSWQPGDEPTIHAANCYPHEHFKNKFLNDIGLVQTEENLLANGVSRIIPLPDSGTVYPPGEQVVIAGWGKTEGRVFSNHLMRADVVVYDWNSCNDEFKHADECLANLDCPPTDIPDHSICTKGIGPYPPGGCTGDSGGPGVVDGILMGVLIGAILKDGECIIGTPNLYTNVAQFIPWISGFIDSNNS